jgi:hypothetical protein
LATPSALPQWVARVAVGRGAGAAEEVVVAVDRDSANWRLFGGGGLLFGGVIWLAGAVVSIAAPGPIGPLLSVIGVIVVGVALFFVAFGQTGSNGAVGASGVGKTWLVLHGVGYVALAVALLLAAVGVSGFGILAIVSGVLIIVGGLLSAYAVYQREVAQGAAKWVLFVPAVIGAVFAVTTLFQLLSLGPWPFLVLGLAFAVTGLLYLLNSRKIG